VKTRRRPTARLAKTRRASSRSASLEKPNGIGIGHAVPVQLLADLNDLFATTSADTLATAAIIAQLTALEDRPWAGYAQGHPITPRHLVSCWKGSGSRRSKFVRAPIRARGTNGRTSLTPSFRRYLPLRNIRNSAVALGSYPSSAGRTAARGFE